MIQAQIGLESRNERLLLGRHAVILAPQMSGNMLGIVKWEQAQSETPLVRAEAAGNSKSAVSRSRRPRLLFHPRWSLMPVDTCARKQNAAGNKAMFVL